MYARLLVIFLAALSFFSFNSKAQNAVFERTMSLGGGFRESGLTLSPVRGGYLLAGSTTSCAGSGCDAGMALFGVDTAGNMQWTRKISLYQEDLFPLSAVTHPSGKVLLLCKTDDAVTNELNIALVLLNGDSSINWIKTFDFDAYDLMSRVMVAGNDFIFCGRSLVVRMDINGNVVWAKTINMPAGIEIELHAPYLNNSGELEISGLYNDPSNINAILWIRMDQNTGTVIQSNIYHAGANGYLTGRGGVSMAGNDSIRYFMSYGSGGAVILSTRSNGTVRWAERFQNFNGPKKIMLLQDGNLILVGNNYSIATYCDAIVMSISPDGTQNWVKAYGGSSIDTFTDFLPERDCYLVCYGYARIMGNQYSSYLVKMDMTGNSGGNVQPATSLPPTPITLTQYAQTTTFSLAVLNPLTFTRYNEYPALQDSVLCYMPFAASGCLSPVQIDNPSDLSKADIKIYPNPGTDLINIGVPANVLPAEWEVIDMQGRLLSTGKSTTQEITLSASMYPSGLYFIRINGDQVYKWVKYGN